MKYNKEIEKQYQIERLKRKIRELKQYRKDLYDEQIKIDLRIQSLLFKLRSYGEKFYC